MKFYISKNNKIIKISVISALLSTWTNPGANINDKSNFMDLFDMILYIGDQFENNFKQRDYLWNLSFFFNSTKYEFKSVFIV